MEQMQGNTTHGAGGNYPMVQGDIKADTGGNINLGIQVINSVTEREKYTAIEYIVQEALNKVLSLMQNRDGLFRCAENHLVKIRDSLKEIRDFIVIAEGTPIKDPKLVELLEKLKDAAYDAEDLLEENEIAGRRRTEEAENMVRAVVTSVFSLDIMAEKLKELSQRLEDIKAECDTFQLKEKVTEFKIEFKKTRETHSFVHKPQVIGRDREKEEIVTFLLSTGLDDVSVIAIVGIGGLGKTTLAQSVFNDDAVQNHFDPKMWICVSDNLEPDNFDSKRLGNKILERATGDRHNLSDLVELQCGLQKALGGKTFLLVLDDVWNENSDKWHGKNGLRDLLLCGGKESRIVVTTRSPRVASIISNIQHRHILKPLSEDVCWSLFCQHAFGIPIEKAKHPNLAPIGRNIVKKCGGNPLRNPIEESVHPNLAPIGRNIVKKCGGNPLAVRTLGGLLCSERSQRKWESVKDSEVWNSADENENGILPALRLSYNHLKPHLKQCFAFCAIFPQHYEIKKELVIKLWMAQGFIPTKRGMELEDTGDEIFDELVMKSFFQDVKEAVGFNPEDGYDSNRTRTIFRMHDLMHDLAHSVMKNEYCFVHDGKSKDISARIRHVSSYGLGILPASLPKAQMLRTCVMFRNAGDAYFQFPCDVGLFKCLRALDFSGQKDKQKVEKQLFTSLGNLQHLRYLNLTCTLIEMLPESLTSLCFLQTLILIFCTELCELPKEMSKLTNLRCLDITGCGKLTHMPPKMGQLSCLQELSDFIVVRTNEIACSGIGELQGLNLRGRLTIKLLTNITDAIDVPRNILKNKPNLSSLDLLWESSMIVNYLEEDREGEVLEKQVFEGLQPHRNLKKLRIRHYGGLKFPSWMMDTTLTELVEITLAECWRCNHLPPLGELPFLKLLIIGRLKNVECIGNEFYGNEVSGGFPSLEELQIGSMPKLKTWSGLEWKGERAFPSLVQLKIGFCPMLTTFEVFPYNQSSFANEDQIRSQSSLQELNIDYCYNLIFSGLGLRYLNSLTHLEIRNNKEFAHVAHELSFLTSLQYLRLDGCHGLTRETRERIGNLTSLRYLGIINCLEMASFPRELQRLSDSNG